MKKKIRSNAAMEKGKNCSKEDIRVLLFQVVGLSFADAYDVVYID